jgi:hypothetical protein
MCPSFALITFDLCNKNRSRSSSVSIVTRLRARRPWFYSRQEQWWIFFFFATASRPNLGFTQASYSMGMRRTLFPGVKQPGCEADHSPLSNAEVKNTWSYTSTPQYAFMAWWLITQETSQWPWCVVKHGDNLIFFFTLPLFPHRRPRNDTSWFLGTATNDLASHRRRRYIAPL